MPCFSIGFIVACSFTVGWSSSLFTNPAMSCTTPQCFFRKHSKSSVSRGHCCRNCGKWNAGLIHTLEPPHGVLCERVPCDPPSDQPSDQPSAAPSDPPSAPPSDPPLIHSAPLAGTSSPSGPLARRTDPMEHTIAPVPGTRTFGLRRNRCEDKKADVVAAVVVVEV